MSEQSTIAKATITAAWVAGIFSCVGVIIAAIIGQVMPFVQTMAGQATPTPAVIVVTATPVVQRTPGQATPTPVVIVVTATPVAVTPSPRSAVVEVRANQGWQDTGQFIDAGKEVSIQYVSGGWTQTAGKEPYHDGADNSTHYICANYTTPSNCVEPIPDFPQGALIGRVGNRLLKVGNSLRFVAGSSGILYLRMNDADDALNDNAGSLIVRITVQ